MALAIVLLAGAAPVSAQVRTYDLEANHSTIGFSVPIFGGMSRVTGKFTDVAASIHYDPADLSTAWVDVSIAVASIDTGIDRRDSDLQSPMWFNAGEYPEILFFSDKIRKTESGFVAAGELTMRGVSRTIELPFSLKTHEFDDGKQILGVSARLPLNRRDFGVGAEFRHTTLENFIGDEILVEIDLWTRAGKLSGPTTPGSPPPVRF